MEFIYREVLDGQSFLLPQLEVKIEIGYPNHQVDLAGTMANFGLDDWTIIFSPLSKPKSGVLFRSFKEIILSSTTRGKDDTLETLYHEIFHYNFPDAAEAEIEELGVYFYLQVKRLEERK